MPDSTVNQSVDRVPIGGEMCPYCQAMPGEQHTPGCLKRPVSVRGRTGPPSNANLSAQDWRDSPRRADV